MTPAPLVNRRAQIVDMRRRGYVLAVIARKFGISERTVQRDITAASKNSDVRLPHSGGDAA